MFECPEELGYSWRWFRGFHDGRVDKEDHVFIARQFDASIAKGMKSFDLSTSCSKSKNGFFAFLVAWREKNQIPSSLTVSCSLLTLHYVFPLPKMASAGNQ
jgi:hypothetical protein